jgi:hypothetical protein
MRHPAIRSVPILEAEVLAVAAVWARVADWVVEEAGVKSRQSTKRKIFKKKPIRSTVRMNTMNLQAMRSHLQMPWKENASSKQFKPFLTGFSESKG